MNIEHGEQTQRQKALALEYFRSCVREVGKNTYKFANPDEAFSLSQNGYTPSANEFDLAFGRLDQAIASAIGLSRVKYDEYLGVPKSTIELLNERYGVGKWKASEITPFDPEIRKIKEEKDGKIVYQIFLTKEVNDRRYDKTKLSEIYTTDPALNK
jgi:hypothetical protein